ncbi:MAG: gliding motility-associated C-terminal domain-containing protein [Saprospirales bacterium]|nr:gliding motility-associated C-terminal domain-containing protein [Saprospirales bacterium]
MKPLYLLTILLISLKLSAQPLPCGPNPDMTSFCAEACVICDINGYTGINDDPEQGEAPPGFCTTTVHHMQWIAFIAGSVDLTITVTPSNCQQGIGLEVGIYETLDCENYNLVTNCDGDIEPGQIGVFTNAVPLTIGQYYYFAMDGNHGDVCNYTINVTEGSTLVPPLPEAEPVAGDATPCFGETETYSIPEITGANFYEWTVDGLPAGDGASVDITWDAFGIHQLCVTAFNVCDTVAPSCTPVFVFPPIGTQLFPEICEGDCFEVADTLVCDAGNFTFILSAANGCDSVIQVQVSVLPEVSSSYSALICDSDSLLVGDTWYFPPGQYAEMQTSYNGCDSIINLTLNAIICEITGETEVQHILCHGDLSGQITFSVVDGTPPFTYTWQQLDGSPSGSGNLSGINTPETISNLPPGGYLIGVQDPFGNDVILTANVFEPPALSLEFETTDFNGYEISCAGGQNGAATATPGGGTPGYTFEWSNGSVQSGINSQPAGVYGLTITDAMGCTLMEEIALTGPPPLDLEALFVDPGCDGFDSGSASVLSASGGVLPFEFAISGGNGFGTNTSFPGLFGGNYTLTVRDANGCEVDTSGILAEPLIPILDAGQDLSLLLGEVGKLQAFANLPLQTIVWAPPTGLSCGNCLDPTAGPYVTTIYVLAVTSSAGCLAIDSLTVTVLPVRDLYVPNIFSPNYDGINDALTVYAGKAVRRIKSFQVFSRWGELVYRAVDLPPNDPGLGWDGAFEGKKMDQGVYAWMAEVEFLDGVEVLVKGDVALVR